jgi:hypothetical protein
MNYVEYIYPIVGATIYAVAAYFRETPLEKFDPIKFGSTIAVGALIGVVAVNSGIPITEQWVGTQIVAYAGVTAIVENVLKSIFRRTQ